MIPKRPIVEVPGDDPGKTMFNNGHVVGWDHRRVVWCFGFCEGSPGAKAFQLTMPGPAPLYVLCDYHGKIRKEHRGDVTTLPDIMADVIE